MFFFSDRRFIYILLAVIVIMNLMTMTVYGWVSLLLTIPGVLLAITFHEYAHAYAATKLGDDTPMIQGRLSLNPFRHLEPIGTVLLLFCGFGWGKPVEINSRNFDRKFSQDQGNAIVAVAGPAMNFVLAIVISIIYCAIYKFAYSFYLSQVGSVVLIILQYAILINLGLGLFNLIPVPPLDGSKILVNFLSYNAKQWFYEHEYVFYFIFLIIWVTGLASNIISPILNLLYKGLINGIGAIFGI